jgi:hypothetical protein
MINHIAVISDLHIGCKLGLYPDKLKIPLASGGYYTASPAQKWIWKQWLAYWEWVDKYTKGAPIGVILNGDELEGVHHNSTTQISHNMADQLAIAKAVLKPIVDKCQGRFYVVRGTPAHVGENGSFTEQLAQELGAVPNGATGERSTYELRLKFGDNKYINAMHHIGGTASIKSKATAPMSELAEIWANAGRWGSHVPDIVIRSHRHEYIKLEMAGHQGDQFLFITPAWQLKTPFAQMISGARTATPQIGGCLITYNPTKKKLWVDKFVRSIVPPKGTYLICDTKNGKKP